MVHSIFAKVKFNENKASLNNSRVLLHRRGQCLKMPGSLTSSTIGTSGGNSIKQAFIQLFSKTIFKKHAYQFQTTCERFWKVAKTKFAKRV